MFWKLHVFDIFAAYFMVYLTVICINFCNRSDTATVLVTCLLLMINFITSVSKALLFWFILEKTQYAYKDCCSLLIIVLIIIIIILLIYRYHTVRTSTLYIYELVYSSKQLWGKFYYYLRLHRKMLTVHSHIRNLLTITICIDLSSRICTVFSLVLDFNESFWTTDPTTNEKGKFSICKY